MPRITTKPTTKTSPQLALHRVATDDADPLYTVGGQQVPAAALVVGALGTAAPADLWIPPPSHPRHDPRTTAPRSPEFLSDVALRGVQTPVLVCVLDGRVEVLDGRGRVLAARDLPGAVVPFRVVTAPASALDARLDSMRANLARTEVDPLTRAALAEEALAAGMTPEAVAAAMAVPVSTVQALVRVAREADDTTKALVKDETIDASTALRITQQPPEVREVVHATVAALVAEAAAAPDGKARSVTGSQKGDAVKGKSGKTAVSRRAVVATIDAAKGRAVKDRKGTVVPAKPAPAPIPRPTAAKPAAPADTVATVRARADAMRAKALALRATTKNETERVYLMGIADALDALFDAQWIVGASHPYETTANAVLRRK